MASCLITGIDTGIGKSLVTGLWANDLMNQGRSIITAKLVQTGCHGVSEDILMHRRLMHMPLHDLDRDGTTCPYVFSLPASPHLAARHENRHIDCRLLDANLERLDQVYDIVLIEGAGGILVPLTEQYTMLDFAADRRLPVLVVTAPRLGSINHTLLTLEALRAKNIPIVGMVYNLSFPAAPEIVADSKAFFQSRYPGVPLVEMPEVKDLETPPAIDFSSLHFPKKP